MSRKMSRREFFASLAPGWLINGWRGGVLLGLIVGAAVSFLFAALIGSDSVLTLLKAGVVGVAIVVAVKLFAKTIHQAGKAVRKSPPFVQVLVTVFFHGLLVAAIAATTVSIYTWWKNGGSMAETYISLGMALVGYFIVEWKKRTRRSDQPDVPADPADWRR